MDGVHQTLGMFSLQDALAGLVINSSVSNHAATCE